MSDLEDKVTNIEKKIKFKFLVKVFFEAKCSSGGPRCPASAMIFISRRICLLWELTIITSVRLVQ